MLLLPSAGTVQIYEIESVQSDTQLTLASVFTGTTGTGKAYAIPTSPAVSIEQFAHEFASTLAYYQQQLSGWQQILTGTGNVTLTSPDGQTVTVRSQQAWDAALDGKADLAQAFRKRGGLGTVDLNTITGEQDGVWTQNSNANATLAKNYPTPIAGSLLVVQDTANGNTAAHQLYFPYNTTRVYIRYFLAGGTWGVWSEVWNSASLVKQTGQFDATAGSVMLNGAWGWGGSGEIVDLNTDAAFLAWARLSSNGSRIFRNSSAVPQYTKQYGVGVLLRSGDTWATISIGYAPSGISGGIRITSGNNSGSTNSTHELWTDQNLNPARNAPTYINITSEDALHAWAQNSANSSGTIRNDGIITATSRFGSGWFSKVQGTYSIFTVGPTAGTSVVRLQAGDSNGYTNHVFWTDKNLIKQTGVNDTAPGSIMLNGAHGLGRSQSAGIAMSTILDGNNAVTAGFVEPASATNWYYQFSPAVVAFRAGGADGSGQLMQVQVGPGGELAARHRTNNAWTDWAPHVTTNTSQTIAGQKTFSYNGSGLFIKPASASQPGYIRGLTHDNGNHWFVGKGDTTFDVVLANQYSTAQNNIILAEDGSTRLTVNSARLAYIRRSNTNYAILASGLNTVADSNGFYKTASPVVKLFADGTSELTSEAEGITTERLSEGVYRISGCLGLNADRAWGGDDGGIDVPMCRNKLPRLWVDYGGDEGSEKINPDGSIVIRTYHRPHPDAPAFARNEIEGYANGDPIDIPHDTFISVRVQMPDVEVQEEVVETVPNEAENDVVLEASAQA
ncbi:pyocin knob domain-containing protein [Candidatus Symbiopectobacterium sp. NZEC151]|uniref:pyocin knob domain-containing protein n=1 Tax=Candidatus Symbiopectobacterium sp. NZEC151 TaxID=2820470 RepID=UPI002226EEFF|nr:pyocin knob domain-containing protein [Candidatus Symbiopectobacterium sp. NZEC151]MCW2476304.1 hypothetical protein [Candidatus Symbiopectobacterium sp. NZEC151]